MCAKFLWLQDGNDADVVPVIVFKEKTSVLLGNSYIFHRCLNKKTHVAVTQRGEVIRGKLPIFAVVEFPNFQYGWGGGVCQNWRRL